ncbi:hypothetical protein DITRI_Ditri04bG0102200 [Diplodiscus trichospermus]
METIQVRSRFVLIWLLLSVRFKAFVRAISKFRDTMAYNLRDRNSLSTRGIYLGSSSSDNDSHDSTFSDPNYGRQPRPPRRPNQNNFRPSEAMQPSAGVILALPAFASSSRNTTGNMERRPPGRPPRARANEEEDSQTIMERSRRGKTTNFSRSPKEKITKRTVLAWLISSSTVKENEGVLYVACGNRLGRGKVNREGILCGCCSHQFTVGEIGAHFGCEIRMPYRHIYLAASKHSLLDCENEAWVDREEDEKRTYNNIMLNSNDKNDGACMVCADGGNLICCDKCPSTFHPSCIFMETIPQGDWLCPYCVCKYCGSGDGILKKCTQCEKQYHGKCGGERLDLMNPPASLFCGSSCRKIHEGLEIMVGVRNELQDGISWTLIHRTEQPFGSSADDDAYNKVQSNSKIALAWLVMNECFLSTRDRHTEIDIAQNIVYNRGSNFPRINFCGFYTAVLEKNDEVISVASIRVHGKRLAEMPFIGTSEKYRRQGMAKMLANRVESALCDLQVEKLVIPSNDELVSMWIQKYSFFPIEEERTRRELSLYNTVMFPRRVVKLQKNLVMPMLLDLNVHPSETNDQAL